MIISFRVCEIYETLMGESGASGWPCTLVRMGGCNLRCSYCDTRYALTDYESLSMDSILNKIRIPYPQHVLITGGEPLMQSGTPILLHNLLERGHKVYLETNGSLDVSSIDPRVVKIIDIKCPTSGQSQKNYYQNLDNLTPGDEIKFVIGSREDFIWAEKIIKKYQIQQRATVLFSPVEKKMEPRLLAEWILKEELEVRLQIQLHKIIWGGGARV